LSREKELGRVQKKGDGPWGISSGSEDEAIQVLREAAQAIEDSGIEFNAQEIVVESGKEDGRSFIHVAENRLVIPASALGGLKRLAQSQGLSLKDKLVQEILADAAVAAIRIHRLGWSGNDQEGPDMHDENVLVLAKGGAVLPADFGAFHKARLGMSLRRDQTLALLGSPPRDLRLAIAAHVFQRLIRGVKDKAQREKIRREVLGELGLLESE